MHEEAHAAQNVITSAIFIFGKIAQAIFDTRVSHSFIFVRYVNIYEFTMELLEESMHVVTLVGRSLIIKWVYRSYSLKIRSFEFTVDLIILGVDNFNVLLGMDWLFDNHVIVKCREK